MESINIHGKQYIPVNERIKHFRNSEEFKGWSMETEIVSITDTSVIMKAIIKDTNGRIISTGFSAEDRSASQINATSMIENAETSAWGRALGNLGIGIDTSVASADEVNNAVRKQNNYTQNNYQQTPTAQPQNKDEIKIFKLELDGQLYDVEYKKCFSKQNNQYFYALVDANQSQWFPKYQKAV